MFLFWKMEGRKEGRLAEIKVHTSGLKCYILLLLLLLLLLVYTVYLHLRFTCLSPGEFEIEEFCELESSLHEKMNNCKKYPDHKDFIPVKDFSIKHLPSRYQDNEILDLICALAALTVRIKVDKLSPDRPKVRYPPIPRYDRLGREKSITGSGWVVAVNKYTEKDGQLCTCRECKNSPAGIKEWGKVEILSVTHVIYDDFEAQHSVFQLDYDCDNVSLDHLPTLRQVGGIRSDLKEDLTHLFCYSHDMGLLDKLLKLVNHYRDLQMPLMDKYFDGVESEEYLTVVISHPHGCSKHITVGELRETHYLDDEGNLVQYKYTTPTCPGSSGGPVFILGRGLWYEEHPHSGTKGGLNQGAVSLD